MRPATFNLRLWFAVASFGTIGLLSAILATWMSDFLKNSLLERESVLAQEFLENIVTVEGPSIFHDYFASGEKPGPALADLASHIVTLPGAFRASVYSAGGRVLWSTDTQLIGAGVADNHDLARALKGERVSEVTDEHKKSEHANMGPTGLIIESYIPIRSLSGKGPVIGVVELYKAPAILQAKIEEAQRSVWLGAASAALLLFGTLFWIVQRGARIIESQQQNMTQMQTFAAIGQMAGAVAHSLRNPMAGIRTSAELWRGEFPEHMRDIPEDVIREVDRMDGYVRDLLAYCRTDVAPATTVDPREVVRTVAEKNRRLFERHGVTASMQDSCPATCRVEGDAKLLEQAITSLVTNAAEAMPDGGRLDLVLGRPSAGVVRLEIVDSGKGIPEEFLKRVTESYFTTKARGLGLGLVLAKGIIERFGGELQIFSAADVGTRVVVDLKAAA